MSILVPLTDRAGILVSGKDRTSWLNGLVTQDLAKLREGEAAYALLVEKKGRIQSDLFALPARNGEDAWMLAVPAGLRDALMTTLDHYLIMEDATLEVRDVPFWLLLSERDEDLGGAHGGAVRGIGTVIAGASVDERAKENGVEIVSDTRWDSIRIERGLPRWGVEFDASLYPQEASLETLAVSFDKGCYLGQEVVYMLQNRGHVKRKLVSLDLDAAVHANDKVLTEAGEEVGEVKSATIGPVSNKPVAIAMVKYAHTTAGTALRVGTVGAKVRAAGPA